VLNLCELFEKAPGKKEKGMPTFLLLRLFTIFFLIFVSSPFISSVNAVENSRTAAPSTYGLLEENFHHDIDELTLAVGETHACALEHVSDAEVGGEIVCWGSNERHESDSPPGLFVQISASSYFTCGISIDEQIICWGDNAPRNLRLDARRNTPQKSSNADSKQSAKQQKIGGISAPMGAFVQISSGSSHVCAVDLFGYVECWGSANHRGQLDVPIVNGFGMDSTSSTNVKSNAGGGGIGGKGHGAFVQVSCGNDQSCVLKKDGTISCWGSSRGGLLRPPTGQFVQVSVSPRGHACAITLSGGLKCWGSLYGPTGGEGSFNGTFVQVSAGDRFTCAIRASGTLFCIGEERTLTYGGLVDVNEGGQQQQQVTAPSPDTSFLEITAAASGASVCGITAGNEPKVICWGESKAISKVPEDLEPSALPLTIF
jgi:alpha-tubulin suppressor-like RCC1 family protein